MTFAALQNHRRAAPRLFYAVGWTAAALVGWIGLPYSWYRSLASWWLYGRDAPRAWPTLMALLALALLASMVVLTARRPAPRRHVVAATLVAWCLSNAALWQTVVSPLQRNAGFTLAFVGSTLWLFWLWAMFVDGSRWPVRCRVFAAALVLACALPACARSRGIDGAGRPLLAWRFRQPSESQDPSYGGVRENSAPSAANRVTLARSASKESRMLGLACAAGWCGTMNNQGNEEYPCFRGRDGLAVVADLRLDDDWTRNPPRELWRRQVGAGWGSFAVSGGFALTQEQRGEYEAVVCYDLVDGREVWSHTDEGRFRGGSAGDGPRATPNVAGQCVFTLGACGRLNCLDRRTGRRHWSIDVLADNRASNLFHGLSGSPLVVDGMVVVSAGGHDGRSLAAYDGATGDRVWRAGDDAAGYGSPQLCHLAGQEQIVVLNRSALTGHDVRTGRVLWTYPWENSTATNCSQSVPLSQRLLFVSSGYGKGCGLLELTPSAAARWTVRPIWENRNLKTTFTSAVVHDGFVFGLDEGILCCIDSADGARRWRAGRYGHGQLLLAGDKLVVQAESGDVALVAAIPDAHRELARFTPLSDKTWSHPALAGKLLVVRNDREAVCYELPLLSETSALSKNQSAKSVNH